MVYCNDSSNNKYMILQLKMYEINFSRNREKPKKLGKTYINQKQTKYSIAQQINAQLSTLDIRI